jgi:hypothetical protein
MYRVEIGNVRAAQVGGGLHVEHRHGTHRPSLGVSRRGDGESGREQQRELDGEHGDFW